MTSNKVAYTAFKQATHIGTMPRVVQFHTATDLNIMRGDIDEIQNALKLAAREDFQGSILVMGPMTKDTVMTLLDTPLGLHTCVEKIEDHAQNTNYKVTQFYMNRKEPLLSGKEIQHLSFTVSKDMNLRDFQIGHARPDLNSTRSYASWERGTPEIFHHLNAVDTETLIQDGLAFAQKSILDVCMGKTPDFGSLQNLVDFKLSNTADLGQLYHDLQVSRSQREGAQVIALRDATFKPL